MKHKFHHLITFASNASITVNQVIHTEYLQDLFHLPLTTQAYEEFLEMETICISLRNSEHLQLRDTWSYIWGNEFYSSTKAYKVLIGYKTTPPHFSWIWKSSCQPKHKIFFWQLLHDRVNTRNMLQMRSMHLQDYSCALCRITLRKLQRIWVGTAHLHYPAGSNHSSPPERHFHIWWSFSHMLSPSQRNCTGNYHCRRLGHLVM